MQYGAMPPCPSCSSADDVGAHGWRDNHICRRVCGLDTSYFVISRRYVCRTCRRAADARRAEAASALGLSVVDDLEAEALEGTPRAGRGSGRADAEGAEEELLGAYTFMAWHPRSLRLLPYGLGGRFPAFLTHRAAVDKSLIDLMRPLFDKGVRPEAFSSTLLELHAKRYWQLHLLHEERYAREKAQPSISLSLNARAAPPPFSTFGDKAGYAGAVPTGGYLAAVYMDYGASIAAYLDNEVKKRPVETLAWDASYKEAKRLAKHNGKQVYVALITGTNELGEVRFQFHVVTDGHEQMIAAIAAYSDTASAYGQQPAGPKAHVHRQAGRGRGLHALAVPVAAGDAGQA
jgi:hypothetical protein